MEIGMISIDRWTQGSQAYFLTHLHADHTHGLSPTWKWGPLFCSSLTAKLFPFKFPQFKLTLLRILDFGHLVVNIINSHPDHDIVIGIDSLGKEDLLLYVSQMLKTKIWVWPERLQTMHLLGYRDIYTTKTSLTRIRAIPRYSFSMETLQGLNMMRPTIGIMPSGLPWVKKIFSGRGNFLAPSPSHGVTCLKKKKQNGVLAAAEIYNQHLYTVPYSDHSYFFEIKEPTNIRGIVSSSPSYVEPRYYFGKFCGIKQESTRSYQKLLSGVGVGKLEGLQIRSPNGTVDSTLAGRKRRIKRFGLLISRVDRVRLSRRLRRGIKIMDSEFSA